MSADQKPSHSTARFRCGKCHLDEGLIAISYGYMIGRLAADGRSLDDYSHGIEDTELCEDTIECPDHIDAPIERLIDGVWHRWTRCAADGCIAGRVWNNYRGYVDCNRCQGLGGYNAPIEQAVAR